MTALPLTFASSEPARFLEQLDAAAFADGVVNVIDISAVRAHAPGRWDRRSEQVEDYVQKAFRKRARASDILLRLSDTQFVAIQPGATRMAAMACCGHAARETLGYFLGATITAPVRLMVASGYGESGLAATEIAPDAIDAAMAEAETGRETAAQLGRTGGWQSITGAPASGRRLVVQTNPRVEATLRLVPIWHTYHQAVASFLIDPSIMGETALGITPMRLTELTPRLAGQVAAQMIDFAAETLATAEAEGRRFALHLPVSLEALTPSRERFILRDHFSALHGARAQLVVMELCDCPTGMPQSRMVELVTVVRPFCRAVIARIDGDSPPMLKWREAGLSGIAVAFDGANAQTSQRDMARLKRVADVAVAPRTLLVAHGLGKRELLLTSWAAGFTHASGEVISSLAEHETQPVRLAASEIFS